MTKEQNSSTHNKIILESEIEEKENELLTIYGNTEVALNTKKTILDSKFEEIDYIINHNFPNIDISKFDDELIGSAIEVKGGDWINIKSDVLKALKISI